MIQDIVSKFHFLFCDGTQGFLIFISLLYKIFFKLLINLCSCIKIMIVLVQGHKV